jgi:ribosomal protein L37AE/L43A
MAFRTGRPSVIRPDDTIAPARLRKFSCPDCGLSVRDRDAARLGYCDRCQQFTGMCGAGRKVICPDVMSVTSWHTPCTRLGVNAWQVTVNDGPCIALLCPDHDAEIRSRSAPWSVDAVPVTSIIRYKR